MSFNFLFERSEEKASSSFKNNEPEFILARFMQVGASISSKKSSIFYLFWAPSNVSNNLFLSLSPWLLLRIEYSSSEVSLWISSSSF